MKRKTSNENAHGKRIGRMSLELLDQSPPADVEAEQRYLGCCILDAGVLEREPIDPGDFHIEAHGRLAEALATYPGPWPITAEGLRGWVTPEQWEAVGGAAGIAAICQSVGHSGHAAHYAKRIRSTAAKRGIITVCCDGLRAAYNGEDDPAAIVADSVARLESIGAGGGQERFRLLSMAELDSSDFSADYVVEGVLARGELCVIGGMYKTLKSSIALDLLLSITSGVDFLGRFRVLRMVHAVYFLGEGHGCFAQGVGRRVAQDKGITLADVEGAYLGTDLPNLDNGGDLAEVARVIKRQRAEFAGFDPLYLGLGDSGDRASNVFVVGQRLAAVQRACQAAGATPIIIHHLRKGRIETDPATLSDLAQAGAAEFAGQWLLLNRTCLYDEANPGVHELRLAVGSRLGHSSAWGLHIEEGTPGGLCGRSWRPEVTPWGDSRRQATESRQRAREAEALENGRQAIIDVLARVERDSKNSIRSEAGLGNGQRFERAWASVVRDGTVVRDGEVRKGNKQLYDAYTLATEGQEL